MSKYSSKQFKANEGWLVLYIPFQEQSVYFLMDIHSNYIFGNILTSGNTPDKSEIIDLMEDAFNAKNAWPKKIFLSWDNPVKNVFSEYSKKNKIEIETEPLTDLDSIIAPIKESMLNF